MKSLNRQLQCKSVKIYRAQTPQNLALTKILHKQPWKTITFFKKISSMKISKKLNVSTHLAGSSVMTRSVISVHILVLVSMRKYILNHK